ncbi:hypothetical protein BDA96_06G265400 [Sorghum bicolor]|uniref:Uncharacterized protein n=1 Tax=Sorghum bicolor TaxID=4558 RepID=A0A921QVK1_SORBI|nr:hypothetical protein BDA96_06G265400 [Sorghum bicolor]
MAFFRHHWLEGAVVGASSLTLNAVRAMPADGNASSSRETRQNRGAGLRLSPVQSLKFFCCVVTLTATARRARRISKSNSR